MARSPRSPQRSLLRVGLHYYRVRWYPGAIDRFREVLRDDPGFSGRDGIYFYLAESLSRTDKTAKAIPYSSACSRSFRAASTAKTRQHASKR